MLFVVTFHGRVDRPAQQPRGRLVLSENHVIDGGLGGLVTHLVELLLDQPQHHVFLVDILQQVFECLHGDLLHRERVQERQQGEGGVPGAAQLGQPDHLLEVVAEDHHLVADPVDQRLQHVGVLVQEVDAGVLAQQAQERLDDLLGDRAELVFALGGVGVLALDLGGPAEGE